MSTDAHSTEMELYGADPGVIRLIMIIVTLFSPLGFIPLEHIGLFGVYSVLPGPYWIFNIIVNPFAYLPLCLLNILYVRQLVRHYQGRSSRDSVHLIGSLSIILPTVIILYISGMFGGFVILYPIPLQFIIGLVIMHRIEGPEIISPWSGVRLDFSWWKWKRTKRTKIEEPVESGEETAEKEDWLGAD